jgi:hypothetical protein
MKKQHPTNANQLISEFSFSCNFANILAYGNGSDRSLCKSVLIGIGGLRFRRVLTCTEETPHAPVTIQKKRPLF